MADVSQQQVAGALDACRGIIRRALDDAAAAGPEGHTRAAAAALVELESLTESVRAERLTAAVSMLRAGATQSAACRAMGISTARGAKLRLADLAKASAA